MHSDELHDLYFLPNTIRMIKSRRMEWAGSMTSMEEKRNVCRVLVGKTEGKRPLGRNKRSNKMDHREVRWGGMNLDSSGSGQEKLVASCEQGDKLSGALNRWRILQYLNDLWFFKKGSTPWSFRRLF
jgi:hypothetical protein